MNKTFKYKGFLGSAEMDFDQNCLYGKILFTNDLVTYQASTPAELEKEFQAAVKDYLETCQELGIEPKKSCSGTFNVRIGPELHEQAAAQASLTGINLNEYVKEAIREKLSEKHSREVHHHHNHTVRHVINYAGRSAFQPERAIVDVTYHTGPVSLGRSASTQSKLRSH